MEHENDIKEALDFVSPSTLTYEEWLMVGMGLKEAGLPVAVNINCHVTRHKMEVL